MPMNSHHSFIFCLLPSTGKGLVNLLHQKSDDAKLQKGLSSKLIFANTTKVSNKYCYPVKLQNNQSCRGFFFSATKKTSSKAITVPVAKPAQWGSNDEEDHDNDNLLQAPTVLSCKTFANSVVNWHINKVARQGIAKNWCNQNWNNEFM